MPKGRISKKSVDALTCRADQDRVFLWDESLAGFGVAAYPNGKKAYVVQYRQNGRSRRSAIGDHGRLTADEARSEAKKLLGRVERGEDPIAARNVERQVQTFSEIASQFLAQHAKVKRKPRTHEGYKILIDRHINLAIGGIRITELRRADVTKLHVKMSATPGVANRAMALVSAICNWASKQEIASLRDNPARAITRYPE